MRPLASIALLVVAGCGLSLQGEGLGTDQDAAPASGDGGGADSTGSGGSSGGSSSGSSVPDGSAGDSPASGPCVSGIPQGWTLVAYEASGSTCPSGYGGPTAVVSSPTAAAGACACSTSVTSMPSCTTGNFYAAGGDSSSSCYEGVGGPTDGSCVGMGFQITPYILATPLPPITGSCTATPVPTTSLVSETQGALCAVPSAGSEAVCTGAPPSGFSACIVTAGSTTCPSGSPFSNLQVVGSSDVLECSCGSCTMQTTCSNQEVVLFPNGCGTGGAVVVPANGECNPTNSDDYINGEQYQAQVHTAPSATPSATFQVMGPQTVCCR